MKQDALAGMIDAKGSANQLVRYYDVLSRFYGWIASPFERSVLRRAISEARIKPREEVLEVGVGPGNNFVDLLHVVGDSMLVHGIDLSPGMVKATRRRALRAGFENVNVEIGDARRLPFLNATFDVLFSSYMLDLIPNADLPLVLAEFRRVLKPSGRMILVNLSKKEADAKSIWEILYSAVPDFLAAYLLGGCRPVLMQKCVEANGFNARRILIEHWAPSEIVIATPASGIE